MRKLRGAYSKRRAENNGLSFGGSVLLPLGSVAGQVLVVSLFADVSVRKVFGYVDSTGDFLRPSGSQPDNSEDQFLPVP